MTSYAQRIIPAPQGSALAAPYPVLASLQADDLEAFLEFFAANVRNPNTRRAYTLHTRQFMEWLDGMRIHSLTEVRPLHVSAYIEQMTRQRQAASVKLALSALRMLFDWLTIRQVVTSNPTAGVKAPRLSRGMGTTPILTTAEASKLLAAIGTEKLRDLRDRAMIAVMLYTFARIGAVLQLQRQDYTSNYGRMVLTLNEKGGKRHQMPVSRNLAPILNAWIEAARITAPDAYLFTALQKPREPLTQSQAYRIVQARAKAAGIVTQVGNHSMRGTGITAYLLNGGTIERAQAMATHADPRTTRMYDRRSIDQLVDDVERIVF